MADPIVSPAAPDTQVTAPAAPTSAAVVKPVPDALKPATPAPKADSTPVTPPTDAVKPTDPKDTVPTEPVVPEKYEFKMPEGMEIDNQLVEAITPVLKEAKVTQEVAQKIADAYSAKVKADAEAQAKAYNEAIEAEKSDTVKALGADHAEQMAFMAKTRDRFFSKETIAMLEARGSANNVHFVQDMIKIGKLISEGRLVEGVNAQGGATPQTMFPSMPNK